MTLSTLYVISFLISFLLFGLSFYIQKEKSESVFTILYLVLVLIHFGYMALSMSNNIQEATLAYKISFLDSTILPYLILLCVLKICGITKRKSLVSLAIASVITYALGLTAGYSDIFYRDIEFHHVAGYSYIIRGHGMLHFLEPVCVVTTIVVSIAIVTYAAFHRNIVSYKFSAFCAAFIAVDVVAYLIQSIIGTNIEILPFMYNILEIALIIVIRKYIGLDIGRDAYISKNILQEYGYFAFDNDGCFIGCDDVAKLYFPELENQKIDLRIKDEFLKKEFITWENYQIDDRSTFKHFKRNAKYIRCSRRPMYSDVTGKKVGYVVEFQDDTAHVNDMNALKEMNEELSSAVENAKKANQSKSIFLSRMSHEIRTPINAIIGMDEVILRETKDSQVKNYAKILGESAKMLLVLVNDLLDFSKIEAGKMELIEDKYSQRDVINNAIQMVNQRALNKDLNLSVKIDGKLPTELYGDHLKIQQVVINLLTNAIKYTEEGSVILEVAAKPLDGDKKLIQYIIRDTGIGIRDSDKDFLFDAFTRTELQRNNYVEGTGLGLAIVSNYVKLMGGEVRVDSEWGVGSAFSVTIPQVVASTEEFGQDELGAVSLDYDHHVSESVLHAPNSRVLVVDDNDTNRDVFKLLLKPTEIHIVDASSGKEAIELLSRDAEFDIIFLDHMMPELDGIETLKAIKVQKLVDDRVPIIALTANATNNARDMYIEKGFDDYLSKPIQIDELERMIANYLPDDMISYVKANEVSTDSLPKLEEFDFEYATRHLGSEDVVKEVAQNVYKSLPGHRDIIETTFNNIDKGEELEKYRIEVHTLKSSAASIGALLLSKICRVAEAAAQDGDVDTIRAITPIILREIDKHYDRLEVFKENKAEVSDRGLISNEDIIKNLEIIRDALEDWDYDQAEETIQWVLSHQVSSEWKNGLQMIGDEIANLNADMAIEIIQQIIT